MRIVASRYQIAIYCRRHRNCFTRQYQPISGKICFQVILIHIASINTPLTQLRCNRIIQRLISGKKEIDHDDSVSVHRRERRSGTFARTLTVPIEVDVENVQAEYRDGILAIYLPRAEADKPRSVTIS